jgi:hypothetical protein
MSGKLLQLVYSETEPYEETPDTITVVCTDSGKSSASAGISRRQFYSEHYVNRGREVCLWWYRLFSTKDATGVCLHDLFEWDGTSALWFADTSIMYPDFWTFPKLMVAIKALELAKAGEVASVRIIGDEPGMAKVFEDNGVACETISVQRERQSGQPAMARIGRGLTGFYRWFVESRILRNRHRAKHVPSQRDVLFYSASFGEWELPGNGEHRYLSEEVGEILESGLVEEARPIVIGVPPAQGDGSAWDTFLDYSLSRQGAVYAQGYAGFRAAFRAYRWGHLLKNRVKEWIARNESQIARYDRWNLSALAIPQIKRAPEEAVRGVIRYEAIKESLRITQPFALLLKDEVYSYGRILVAAARAAGTRTVSLQHGTIYASHWCYVMDRNAEGLARPPLPDVLGVYGAAVSRLLVEQSGMPAEILRIAGARRFRALDACMASDSILEFAKSGKPLILVAGQMHQDMARIYDWAFQACEKREDALFVFKPHPRDRERVDSIKARCSALQNAMFYSGPLGEVFPAACATVSGHSTVLLESVWLMVPAISVQISGEEPAEWQTEAGMVTIARTAQELDEALRKAAAGTLASEADRAQAVRYLEEFLGASQCRNPRALVDLFGGEPGGERRAR